MSFWAKLCFKHTLIRVIYSSFESLSHVSEVPLKPESSTVAVAIAVAGVIFFDSDGGPSTFSSFRVLPSERG